MLRVPRKEAKALAKEIAQQLGETEPKPRYQIARIIMLCGIEFAQEMVKQALEVEADGGLLTSDGERRRTLGGVFFYLARTNMPEEERQQIFYPWYVEAQRSAEHEAQFPPFDWDERMAVVESLSVGKGEVAEVKINITGRPGEIERHRDLVITTMEDRIGEHVNLPSGVPRPSSEPMTYTVYISSRQWERIESALENPDDEMIVEGLCAFDNETGGVAVFSTYATTRKLQKKDKRQQRKREASGRGKKPSPPRGHGRTPADSGSGPDESQEIPALSALDIEIPSGVPDDVARKLLDLHKAAATFRQKLANILAQPEDQRYGLEMTQRLLNNTETQIEELERQYVEKP